MNLRLKMFLEYFLKHWLPNQTNLEIFNRDNNDLEGWHKKIQKKLQYGNHFNLWTFIKGLKLFNHDTTLEEIQIHNGLVIGQRSNRYRLLEGSLRMYINNHYISDIDSYNSLR